MSDLIDILHTVDERAGRSASSLIALRPFPGGSGVRISHLPIDRALNEAWVRIIGAPFFQAQSVARAALRRGTPFAITGSSPLSRASLHLLALDLLRNEPDAVTLLIAPDPDQALLHEREATALARFFRPVITIAATSGFQRSVAPTARLVITTLPELHSSLLRFHDRAWHSFWRRLRLILIADLHTYHGIAASHLGMILLRAGRLAAQSILLGGNVAPVSGADAALHLLSGREWRLMPATDLPYPATTLALWQSDGKRQREAIYLAEAFLAHNASVNLVANYFEVGNLRAAADHERLSVALRPLPADVQIITGADVGPATFQAALHSGSKLVILLLDQGFSEPALQRLAKLDLTSWPLLQPAIWPPTTLNPFVAALHLVCAASERPLRDEEVRQWQLEPIVERLAAQKHLYRLPGTTSVWLPGAQSDPYITLALHAAGAEPLQLCDEQGGLIGVADPSLAGRWAHLAAALPPLRGGQQVVERDDETGTIRLASREGRRSLPLRRCQVRIRDQWARRELRRAHGGRGPQLSWGRVVIEEITYAYREQTDRSLVQERMLAEPFTQQWQSQAIWVKLSRPLKVNGQLVGWSCAAAIALRTLARLEDCVTAYDPATQHLYIIDAQPNGNGVAEWLYEQLEAILPLAYDIALYQRTDPLFEELARIDMDWLLTVLGGESEELSVAPELPPMKSSRDESALRVESVPRGAEGRHSAELPRDTEEQRSEEGPHSEVGPRGEVGPHSEVGPRGDSSAQVTPAEPLAPERRRSEPVQSNRSAGNLRNRFHRAPDQPTPLQSPPPVIHEPEPPLPVETPVPDAEAILARLRQRRVRSRSSESPVPPTADSGPAIEPRFQPGDRIICMPYGAGRVRLSIVNGDREILLVEFAEHGELRIDPSVNLVRRLPPEEHEMRE